MMTSERFGWCFIGAGSIARRVLADLPQTEGGAYVASVYARGMEHARAFAELSGATPYTDLDAAIADPAVRAVYVATPHTMHREHTLAAIRHGKPVLCEKPFAMNLREATEMIEAARQANVYLMEGMWTRLNPVVRQALKWVHAGRIGRVLSLSAEFASRVMPEAAPRVFDKALGGGALLDVGVYPVAMAHFVFGGAPHTVQAMAAFTQSGVDSQCAMQMGYEGGALARLFTATEVSTPVDTWIHGEKGVIHIPHFFAPKAAVLRTEAGEERHENAFPGEGFQFEFDAVMADVRAGRLENDILTHRYTLDVMAMLDDVRGWIGLRYAQDE